MAIKSDITNIDKRFNATKKNAAARHGNIFLIASSLLTLGCKSSETQSTASDSTISQSEDNNVSIVLSEGQEVQVKVLDVDRAGKVKLSMKEV